MFHLRFGLSDHLKALRDFVFGSRRRVKKVRIFRAWFSQLAEAIQRVSNAILNLKISWQAQYLVRLEGDFACSAHWK